MTLYTQPGGMMIPAAALSSIGMESPDKIRLQRLEDSISWAALPSSSSSDATEIRLLATDAANSIFVGLVEFAKDVKEMEKTLDREMNRLIITLRILDSSIYEKGLAVAAKDSTGKWARAIVSRRGPDVTKVSVFFVDHGTQANLAFDELFPIPRKYIVNLPFQAIQIFLQHIFPNNTRIPQDCQDNPPLFQGVWTLKDKHQVDMHIKLRNMTFTAVYNKRSDLFYNSQYGTKRCSAYDGYIFNRFMREIAECVVTDGIAGYYPGEMEKWDKCKKKLLKKYKHIFSTAPSSGVTVNGVSQIDEDDEIVMHLRAASRGGRDKNNCNIT